MATADLIRRTANNVEMGEYTQVYTVPTGKVLILSGVYTKGVDDIVLKIGSDIFKESLDETERMFKGFVCDEDEIIEISHENSGVSATIAICGELFDKA